MGEMTLTAEDIQELLRRLDDMEPALDERQRTLLLAIFSLANEALATRRQDEVTGFGFGMDSLTALVVKTPTEPKQSYLRIDLTEVLVTSVS
jgi:hypothetical protein